MNNSKYITVYNKLRADIVCGAYRYGARLPSKRRLAEDADVSVITVQHAYELLCDEGFAEAKQKSGYYVIYREGNMISGAGGSIVHGRAQIQENAFPFSTLAKTMRRVLNDYGEDILSGVPHNGCEELRSAISAYLLRTRGIKISTEQIVIGSGAEYLYGLITRMLGHNLIYAAENPSYEKITGVYAAEGVTCRLLPICADGIDSASLASTDAAVLHVTPYRSFPSGVTATASKLNEYLRWADKDGRYIIEDDFESEFTLTSKPHDTLFSLSGRQNVIYVNSFSKTISKALRVGYAILPQQLLGLFYDRVGFYACTVPTFEQYVLAELLNSGDFERHINRVRRKMRSR